jgi:hypothetical protein
MNSLPFLQGYKYEAFGHDETECVPIMRYRPHVAPAYEVYV